MTNLKQILKLKHFKPQQLLNCFCFEANFQMFSSPEKHICFKIFGTDLNLFGERLFVFLIDGLLFG